VAGAVDIGGAMKFLHTADWQLGMTRHFLDPDAQPRYTGARIDAIRRLGEIAAAQGCDFVLVCGDVFESNAVSPRIISRSLEAMRSIPVPVYLLPGNHDPLDASSIYTSAAFLAACPDNVHVLSEPGCHTVGPGTEIVAAPWFSKRPLTDLVAEVTSDLVADGTLRIVAAHGSTDTLSPDAANPALIRMAPLEAALKDGRIHYVALGDRHSPTPVGTSGRVWYSGAQEVTDYDEINPGQVLVVDIEIGSAPQVTEHQVGEWYFLDLSAHVNGPDDLRSLEDLLASYAAKERKVVRLSLTGTLGLKDKAALDALMDSHTQLFAALNLWERHTHLAVHLDGDELTDLGVSGFAGAAVAELSRLARSDNEQAIAAQNALSLLYRLAGGAK
jgi:DNA repair exonuclease SbcCD nuclease subunit